MLAHNITEIKKYEFKGRAFKNGHIIRQEDVCHLQRLGKAKTSLSSISLTMRCMKTRRLCLAKALMGNGVATEGEPKGGQD